jgi:outer membrane protein OmpA-like peptidoglycan-associated protein
MHRRSFLLLFTIFISITAFGQVPNDRRIVPVISSPRYTEFAPTISADGRTMIFGSDVNRKRGIDESWELFESHLLNDSVWSTPVALKAINEKCDFLAGPSLSYDGNTLYFTAFIEGQTESEDIYFSERLAGNNWSEPRSIGSPVNTNEKYEGFPSISADGNSLYFIRVNEEGEYHKESKENCFKIYVSKRQPDGAWGEPETLPDNISEGCERDPKIMADNHTLIFSSIRDGGKGKFDLYQSRLLNDGSWDEPEALDFINSAENDQSPCISAAGNIMYFYSQKDIYQVTIPQQYRQLINVTVQGSVRSAKDQSPLRATLHVKEVGGTIEFAHESAAADGRFSLVLAAGKKFEITVSHADYLGETVGLDFSATERYEEVKKDILLLPEYKLQLTVVDADLKKPMKAWLDVSGPGIPFRDTARIDAYPLAMTLQAGKNYQLKASAPGYPELVTPWNFERTTFKSEMTYTIPLVHEKVKYIANVTHVGTGQKSKLKVYFNNENIDEVIIAEAGEEVSLRKGDRYQVMTSSEKGFFFSTAAIVAGEDGSQVISLVIIPVEVGAQLTLNYITFATASADLNHTSFLELDRVIEFLQQNPTVEIEISAHTDDVGNADYNLKLSQRRAQSAVNYMTSKGLDKKKLKAIGYGKDKPAFPNDTDENRAKNRRVELRIVKVG